MPCCSLYHQSNWGGHCHQHYFLFAISFCDRQVETPEGQNPVFPGVYLLSIVPPASVYRIRSDQLSFSLRNWKRFFEDWDYGPGNNCDGYNCYNDGGAASDEIYQGQADQINETGLLNWFAKWWNTDPKDSEVIVKAICDKIISRKGRGAKKRYSRY